MKPSFLQQDGIAKAFSFIQILLFLAMFVGLYLLVRRVVRGLILRILCLLVIYFVVSMITFCIIRPLAMRAEAAVRKLRKS